MNDKLRLAIMAVVQSLFPVLQIFHLVDFTGDQIALLMAFINNVVLLTAFFWKSGQGR